MCNSIPVRVNVYTRDKHKFVTQIYKKCKLHTLPLLFKSLLICIVLHQDTKDQCSGFAPKPINQESL